MAYLKIAGGAKITDYVSFSKTQSLACTQQTALDGTVYLTRFGSPVYTYALTCYVNDDGREMLFSAYDLLTLLEVSVKAGTFQGRIKDMSDFKEKYYGWYEVTVQLAEISEVSSR